MVGRVARQRRGDAELGRVGAAFGRSPSFPGAVSEPGEGNVIPGLQGHMGTHRGEAPLAYN